MSDERALLGGALILAFVILLWIGAVWRLQRKHDREWADAGRRCTRCGVREQWHIDSACRPGTTPAR